MYWFEYNAGKGWINLIHCDCVRLGADGKSCKVWLTHADSEYPIELGEQDTARLFELLPKFHARHQVPPKGHFAS